MPFDIRHDTPQSPTALHLATRMSPIGVVSAGSRPPRRLTGPEVRPQKPRVKWSELRLSPIVGRSGSSGEAPGGGEAQKRAAEPAALCASRALLLEAAAEP